MKRFIIIDGHAIIHRGYHALPPLTTKDGTIVNAVFGFSSMLLKVLNTLKPDHIAVSFDRPGATFRDEIFQDYKATRERADQDLYDQIPFCYDVVKAFNIPIYEEDGFEADDLIGTIVHKVKKEKDMEIIVVTGDKDLLQIVEGDHVQVALLNRGLSDFVLYNEAKVLEKFGFGPAFIPDFKGLMGDPSDNIPGVKGIGKVTATKLIQKFGTVEEIYKQNDEDVVAVVKAGGLKKLQEGKADAAMSKKLATIIHNVKNTRFKLADTVTHDFDRADVEELLRKFEFFSLLKRIPGSLAKEHPKKKGKKRAALVEVTDTNLDELESLLSLNKLCVVEPVISGKAIFSEHLDGLLFVFEGGKSAYMQSSHKKFQQVLRSLCASDRVIIGHDLKRFLRVLIRAQEVCSATLFDVMIASYIVNSSTRAHDLASILDRELGIVAVQSEMQTNLFGADIQGLADVYQHLFALHTHFTDALKEAEQREVFSNMEMPLIPVLASMEVAGIKLDVSMLKALSTKVTKDLATLTKNIHEAAGKEFNVASSAQLRDVLFDDLALPTHGIKKGKTGYSTAARELGKLREHHEIIGLIEQFREIEKLRNTYIDVLPGLADPTTDRIHTTFNQTVAQTGRLSSSDPNLQNIPIRTDSGKQIRDAFIAEKGYTLVAADYSQIELRIAAHLSQDERLLEIFRSGEDVHRSTAAIIQGVKPEDVTKEQRRAAKEVNFGVLYGMGAFGLAERTGLPQWQAKEFIDAYFAGFPRVRTFLDDLLEEAKNTGYVETLYGRRRQIPELSSSNYQVRASGERMAINMPMQGTQADIIKIAMLDVAEKMRKEFSDGTARLLLQVHDELVFEVREQQAEGVAKKIEKIMAEAVQLDVPVVVESHIGSRWGELK